MTPERPPLRSERLLRATLDRNPSPRVHRRRHSHVPPSSDNDDDIFRAAFLYRTPATSSVSHRTSHSPSPTRDYNYYSHHPRPASPSPTSSRRQSLQRSPDAMITSANLQRHNSTPVRRRSDATDIHALPLTPHEQVLRARLERVLLSGRVVDDHENRHARRSSRDDAHWPWSDHSVTPPKSASSSDHGHASYHHQGHNRSRSKTDPLTSPPLPPTPSRRRTTGAYGTTTPALASPYLTPQHKFSSTYYHHPGAQRNNSHSSTSTQLTPPLTADASPVLGEPLHHLTSEEDADVDDERLLLTPPPTPPLFGAGTSSTTATATPNLQKRSPTIYYHGRTPNTDPSIGTRSGPTSPYIYPYSSCKRLDVDADVQSLDLSSSQSPSHCLGTFNARKASDRCRLMEGYVSFASVEGLGTPPDGVDDSADGAGEFAEGVSVEDKGEKRGRGLIGTWARKLFVNV